MDMEYAAYSPTRERFLKCIFYYNGHLYRLYVDSTEPGQRIPVVDGGEVHWNLPGDKNPITKPSVKEVHVMISSLRMVFAVLTGFASAFLLIASYYFCCVKVFKLFNSQVKRE